MTAKPRRKLKSNAKLAYFGDVKMPVSKKMPKKNDVRLNFRILILKAILHAFVIVFVYES